MAARTLYPSERVDQARETHAHIHERDLAHDRSRTDWRGGQSREKVELQLRENLRADGIIANDDDIGAQKRYLPVQVQHVERTRKVGREGDDKCRSV